MNTVVEQAGRVLWGIHEEAADCSHRPEHVRRLFIDANAAHRFAQALADAGLLVSDEMGAVIGAAVLVAAELRIRGDGKVGTPHLDRLAEAVDTYLAAGADQ